VAKLGVPENFSKLYYIRNLLVWDLIPPAHYGGFYIKGAILS